MYTNVPIFYKNRINLFCIQKSIFHNKASALGIKSEVYSVKADAAYDQPLAANAWSWVDSDNLPASSSDQQHSLQALGQHLQKLHVWSPG